MASSTSDRTGVVAALSRYVMRLVMKFAIYKLDGLHAKLEHVVDFLGLGGIERLAVAPPDERSVVRRLDADQFVEVLPGGKDLAGRLRAVELRRVAANRLHLRFEYVRDIDDERRLHRIFPVRERIQELVWPMRIPTGARRVLRQPSEIAPVATELGCDAVVWMPADGEGEYHHARFHATDQLDE